MRILIAGLLALLSFGAVVPAVVAQTNPPPPSDGGDGHGCDHEKKEPTTS